MRTKSCRVGIRISEETRKRIEDSGKNISEYIREMLEGDVEHDVQQNVQQNEIDKLHQRIAELEGVHTDIDDILKDIGQMAKLSGTDLKSVLSSLQFKLTFNDIEIVDGELAVYKSLWDEVSEDEEVEGLIGNLNSLCDERGVGLSEAYKQVLMVGGKIVYANVRDGGMEHG